MEIEDISKHAVGCLKLMFCCGDKIAIYDDYGDDAHSSRTLREFGLIKSLPDYIQAGAFELTPKGIAFCERISK